MQNLLEPILNTENIVFFWYEVVRVFITIVALCYNIYEVWKVIRNPTKSIKYPMIRTSIVNVLIIALFVGYGTDERNTKLPSIDSLVDVVQIDSVLCDEKITTDTIKKIDNKLPIYKNSDNRILQLY